MKRSIRRIGQYIGIMAVCISLGLVGCGASGSGNDKQGAAAEAVQENAPESAEAAQKNAPASAEAEQDVAAQSAEAAPAGDSGNLIANENMAGIGIHLHLPEVFENLQGMTEISGEDISDGKGIYQGIAAYAGITHEEYAALEAKEELTEEDIRQLQDTIVPLFRVSVIDEGRSAEDLAAGMNERAGDGYMNADQLKLIGQAGDCSFFEYVGENSFDGNRDNLRDEFAKECDTLLSLKDTVLENMEFTEVKRPYADLIGKKVSFRTTDLDGNTISSEEIFSKHEITMVNVWATWCHWCVVELPELEKVNARLAEKDCAVVGLCGDADSEETIGEAKRLLSENGDTYLNICPWEGWEDTFDMSGGWPTTFFVDRNGTIVGKPVLGADINAYEPRVAELLK